jgi:hypothetical protein
MNNTALLKEMGWQSLLSKYGDEDVMLTTKELDGTPGKLKDVDNPAVYLHNSEVHVLLAAVVVVLTCC